MTPHPSRWSFASDAVRAELGEFPETLLEAGEEVKANPVRRVVRSGGYFLKCDRRGRGAVPQRVEEREAPGVAGNPCGRISGLR
ncbi:MAG: hypothetical protein V8T86_01235 [Victivallis sp.]